MVSVLDASSLAWVAVYQPQSHASAMINIPASITGKIESVSNMQLFSYSFHAMAAQPNFSKSARISSVTYPSGTNPFAFKS